VLQGRPDQNGNKVLVALGGNAESHAGNARQTVEAAMDVLAGMFGKFRGSRLYKSPSFPEGNGPDFVNAAASFETLMPPVALLEALHKVEATFGRERLVRWGRRTLDLDLIAFGQTVRPDPDVQSYWRGLDLHDQIRLTPDTLILPHPRVQDRAFVLVPMADVAPDWVHPCLGLSVLQMLDSQQPQERADIIAI